MEKFVVDGGYELQGELEISGAKNAAVAILPATILAEDICRVENIPDIRDVQVMVKILRDMGATVRYINSNTLEIDTRYINSYISGDAVQNNGIDSEDFNVCQVRLLEIQDYLKKAALETEEKLK